MKYSEMNARQQKAYKNIIGAANWLIGGLENGLSDYEEDSEDYKECKMALGDRNELANEIYRMATTDVYEDGSMHFGTDAAKFMNDIKFCGKDWLMERIEKRLTKMGY